MPKIEKKKEKKKTTPHSNMPILFCITLPGTRNQNYTQQVVIYPTTNDQVMRL
jgi:hypothetical protein